MNAHKILILQKYGKVHIGNIDKKHKNLSDILLYECLPVVAAYYGAGIFIQENDVNYFTLRKLLLTRHIR